MSDKNNKGKKRANDDSGNEKSLFDKGLPGTHYVPRRTSSEYGSKGSAEETPQVKEEPRKSLKAEDKKKSKTTPGKTGTSSGTKKKTTPKKPSSGGQDLSGLTGDFGALRVEQKKGGGHGYSSDLSI